MNQIDNSPSISIATPEDVQKMQIMEIEMQREIEDDLEDDAINSSLASHIITTFTANKDARRNSGIEEKMLQSLRAYNGHYDPEDLARIAATSGSGIYMNLTATKCRVAASWIRDILLSSEKPWEFEPTPVPDIPEESREKIKQEISQFVQDSLTLKQQEQEKENFQLQQQEQAQAQQGAQGQQGPQAPTAPPIPKPVRAATELKDLNQMYRDVYDAFQDEVYNLASHEVKKFEKIVEDQLAEGYWDNALAEFIEDFVVFQAAILKGPIVTAKNRISWVNGKSEVKKEYIFKNKRVSPLDIYPSANANNIQDGNLCEHVRFSYDELYNLLGVDGYNDEVIRSILQLGPSSATGWLDNGIEEDKAVEEYRGDSFNSNEDTFHGIHYFGCANGEQLRECGVSEEFLDDDELKSYQVEAILVDNEVIFVEINSDPLLRRPYYKASFQNIPGSWWGRSLPELMRDVQRMCNATARALSNNMGVASGPQVEVYVDRLAADEDLEDIYPFKIWQVTSDPTGAGGRAVTFWQPTSNAEQLLRVYEKFELLADDVTGVPKYAAGNERTAGAGQTAQGMAMLLEATTKGIKDAIRHIDDGLLKPRVEYQFYLNMISDPELSFTGDVVVVAKGSDVLINRGTREQRRNEFLNVLANQQIFEVIGIEGMAEILREMAKSLGLGVNIIPSRVELKFRQAQKKIEMAQAQKSQMEAEAAKERKAIEAVQMQVQQAEAASQRNMDVEAGKLELKKLIEQTKAELEMLKLQQTQQLEAAKITAGIEQKQIDAAQKDRTTNKNIALSVQSNYKDKNNQE